MPLTASDSGGGEFVKVPVGTHLARACGVIDLGMHENKRYGKHEHKIMIMWECPNELTEDGKPMTITERYTNSLHEKANLRKHLEAWRGRSFSPDELAGFDVFTILNVPCYIVVAHNKTEIKTYANVTAVTALPKGVDCPELVHPIVQYSPEDPNAEQEWEALDEWIQKMAAPYSPR